MTRIFTNPYPHAESASPGHHMLQMIVCETQLAGEQKNRYAETPGGGGDLGQVY